MCGQFQLNENDALRFKHTYSIDFEIPIGNIVPDQEALILLYENNQIRPDIKRFGWKEKSLLINARQETLLDKPTFKKGHPCLIPASSFYEWNSAKERLTFFDDHLLYLAGLYYEDRFLIITTSANRSMKATHNRMPLIFQRENAKRWLTDPLSIRELLKEPCIELQHKQTFEQGCLF